MNSFSYIIRYLTPCSLPSLLLAVELLRLHLHLHQTPLAPVLQVPLCLSEFHAPIPAQDGP